MNSSAWTRSWLEARKSVSSVCLVVDVVLSWYAIEDASLRMSSSLYPKSRHDILLPFMKAVVKLSPAECGDAR